MRRVLRFLVLGLWAAGCGASTHPGQINNEGGTCECNSSQTCCDGTCANLQNDPHNCGRCGVRCGSGSFCRFGQCSSVSCSRNCPSGFQCCGDLCCGSGQLCCARSGSVSGSPMCATQVNGTCPP